MHKAARILLALCFSACTQVVLAQAVPPPPADAYGQEQRMRMPDMTPDQRERMREEHRQRQEAWRQMSQEERHQFRSDIRDAGRSIYPRGRHRN